MNTGKKYHTRQKDLILSCLCAEPDLYLTIRQIADRLRCAGQEVGLTTIYRNLEKLAEERLILKSSIDGVDGSCYRCAPPQQEESCFYLKCERCGELDPIHCTELKELYAHVSQNHHVSINPTKTVFYGICAACLPYAGSLGITAADKPCSC